MSDRPRIREVVSTKTPLGIRFWDPVNDVQIGVPLNVRLFRAADIRQSVEGVMTRSGNYVFSDVPGLRAYEHPTADDTPIPDESVAYLVHVTDPSNTYLATLFGVDLPLPYQGIYPFNPDAPDTEDNPPGFYLFPGPARSRQVGAATVYAHVVVEDGDQPAAYAVVEALVAGVLRYGIVAENGGVTLQFPYPTFTVSDFGGGGPGAQTWDIRYRVFYEPNTVTFPLTDIGIDTPYLKDVMEQGSAAIWLDQAGTTSDQVVEALPYGEPYVLSTGDTSTLRISAAT